MDNNTESRFLKGDSLANRYLRGPVGILDPIGALHKVSCRKGVWYYLRQQYSTSNESRWEHYTLIEINRQFELLHPEELSRDEEMNFHFSDMMPTD